MESSPTPMIRAPWTAADDDAIRAEIARGGNIATVAKLLGRTQLAIMSRAHRAKISLAQKPAWTPDQDEILRAEAVKGRSARQIGAVLGKSRDAVIGRSNRLGVRLLYTASDALRQKNRAMDQIRRAKRAYNFRAFGYFKEDFEL